MAEKKEEKKAAKESTPEEEASRGKKKKLLLFVGLGVILIAVIAGAAFFFLASSGSKDQVPENAEQKAAEGKEEAKVEKEPEKNEKGAKKEPQETKGAGEKKDEKKGETATKEEVDEKKKNDKKTTDKKIDGVDFGCTMPMGPFHLNLGNPLENRFIRLDLAIEYGCSEDQKSEIEKRIPQLKNAVISITTRKTREFLLGPDGKEQLRKEILNRVNHFMTKKIDDVYITEIIIE